MYATREFINIGGLACFGVDHDDLSPRALDLSIGSLRVNLQVEQPAKFGQADRREHGAAAPTIRDWKIDRARYVGTPS